MMITFVIEPSVNPVEDLQIDKQKGDKKIVKNMIDVKID